MFPRRFMYLNPRRSTFNLTTVSPTAMSKICYVESYRMGCYDTNHTRDVMNTQFASKLNASSDFFNPNFKVHQASFQAYKYENQDRTAVLETDYGLIVGVFDGHYGIYVSDYASRNLMKEVDSRISLEIVKNTDDLDDAIPTCLIDTIEAFDATLHRTMIERMRAMDSKPWNEWTLDDVPRFLGMKEMGENDPYPVMRRSCTGSTALIAVILAKKSQTGEQSMWVASLGDCEGNLGRIVDNIWTATPLNDLHNLQNPAEVRRLEVEHPGEDDLVVNGRTKGQLGVTRALGNAMLKVPLDLTKVLSTMWGCPIFPSGVAKWEAQEKHTPPYISSTPSVARFSIQKGDVLVFSSDGLRSSLEKAGVPDQDLRKLIVSLAGMDGEVLSPYEKVLGHSFISSTDIQNVADRMIRNILFGLDDDRMAKETMITMDETYYTLQDDISVVTVQIT